MSLNDYKSSSLFVPRLEINETAWECLTKIETNGRDYEITSKLLFDGIKLFCDNKSMIDLLNVADIIVSDEWDYDWAKLFNLDFCSNVVKILHESNDENNTEVLVYFIGTLIILPNSVFIVRFSDSGLINVLFEIIKRYPEIAPKITNLLAILISNNYDHYVDMILDNHFDFVCESLIHCSFLNQVITSSIFLYSFTKNVRRIKQSQIDTLIESIISVLQIQCIQALVYILSSLLNLIQSFKNEFVKFCNTKITFCLINIMGLNDIKENVIIVILSIFSEYFKSQTCYINIIPSEHVLSIILDYSFKNEVQISQKSISTLITAVKNYPPCIDILNRLNINRLLLDYFTESSIIIKRDIFQLFSVILMYCEPDISISILSDPAFNNYICFINSIHDDCINSFLVATLMTIQKSQSAGLLLPIINVLNTFDIVSLINEFMKDNIFDDHYAGIALEILSYFEENK